MRPLTPVGQRSVSEGPTSADPQLMSPELGEHIVEALQLERTCGQYLYSAPVCPGTLVTDARNRRSEQRKWDLQLVLGPMP